MFGKFTGYGLRVGGAGAVASSSAGLDVLRALGGCSLVAVFVYIRSCLPAALQVSKRFGFGDSGISLLRPSYFEDCSVP